MYKVKYKYFLTKHDARPANPVVSYWITRHFTDTLTGQQGFNYFFHEYGEWSGWYSDVNNNRNTHLKEIKNVNYLKLIGVL